MTFALQSTTKTLFSPMIVQNRISEARALGRMRMAKGLSPVRRALVGGLLLAAVALPVQCRVGSEISDDSTSKLFNEPYRPDESRHYDADSSTFSADAGRQFDLSYADGTVLRGFNGEDVVQVRPCPQVWGQRSRAVPACLRQGRARRSDQEQRPSVPDRREPGRSPWPLASCTC